MQPWVHPFGTVQGATTEVLPTIAMLQDIGGRVGYGARWDEVQSTIHKALGSNGLVTNGSFCYLDMWALGFQMIGGRVGASHTHVNMTDFGKPVNIFGFRSGMTT